MDTKDEAATEVNEEKDADIIPTRPISGDPNARRGVVNADNFVDLIVAGRKKNISKFIPSAQQPSTRRPRRIIMSDNDFKFIFGAAAGTLRDYAERPEIEIAVIKMVDLNAIPTAELTKPSLDEEVELVASSSVFDLSMELSAPVGPNDTNFRILYDNTRCAFILTQNIEDRMLTILRERRLGVKLSLPSISEAKEELDNNMITTTNIKSDFIPNSKIDKDDMEEDDGEDHEQSYRSQQDQQQQHQDLRIGMPEASLSIAAADNLSYDFNFHNTNDSSNWQLSLETSFFLYGKGKDPKAYYTIDSLRQRLWRRFIRLYIDPILADQAHFAAMQARLAKEVERKALAAMSGLEVIYTPTDSEDESSVASASTIGSKKGNKHHKPSSSGAAAETAARHHKKKTTGSSSNKDKTVKKGDDNNNAEQEKKKEMPRTALMKRMATKKVSIV